MGVQIVATRERKLLRRGGGICRPVVIKDLKYTDFAKVGLRWRCGHLFTFVAFVRKYVQPKLDVGLGSIHGLGWKITTLVGRAKI